MTNKTKYGFSFKRSLALDEINATLYEYTHIKTGASLIYLDRDDDNKTFAIGFATPPCDDTGVFHIIEHSVLCGSEKYPLNDPFAEMLKGSLNTFLNAITYEDRTIYPVSSRCERDFINLVDIYMDAVFAPNMLKNPSIFHQEGWHYEYDAESNSLSRNGVVYNEMKGAYSSPDELGADRLNRALFSGTSYGHDSGGNPNFIPELSYEMFKSAHEKYYHPSGAKIILDGKMNIDKLLSLIDSHLNKFDRREIAATVEASPVINPETVEIKYEISDQESEQGKARVLYGYVFSDFTDKKIHLAASVLCDILCGSNASPLKKALLEKGLAKDASMYVNSSKECSIVIEVRDADETRFDEIDETIRNIIFTLSTDGIDKNNLTSSLNSIEFRLKERDYGTLPIGVIYAMSIFGDWLKGANPENAVLLDDIVMSVRDEINGNYFENTLRSITIDNPRRAKVIMLPDKALSEENARREKEELDSILASMSKEELDKIIEDEANLRLWQSREPSEDELATIPKLALADIPESSGRPVAEVCEVDGVKLLRCNIKTNGIVYVSLFFDSSDLVGDEFVTLSMLSAALVNFPTKKRDALSLQNDIKANLGGLFSSFAIGTRDNVATPYLKIGARALSTKTDDMIRLISEVLLESKIESTEEMGRIIAQSKANLEDLIISSGDSLARSRAEASYDEGAAISEYLLGYEAYRVLSDINGNAEKIAEMTDSVSRLLGKLIDKSRLIISVTGDVDDDFVSKLISHLPDSGSPAIKKVTPPCAEESEFFLLPTKVAYAVVNGRDEEVKNNIGLLRVARSVLSYEYLWNTVRVQSGAYGTGFISKKNGSIAFYSYRDPSPARSLGFYHESSSYLRELADGDEDITKFIIGAIGEYDTLISPRVASAISTNDYFSGWTPEKEAKVRAEMLNMTSKDLHTVANLIDNALKNKSVVIVGGNEHLDALEEKPKRIIKI